MIASSVWDKLVSTLQNNPDLSKYIKYVYEGRRYEFEPNSLPHLQLEPVSDGELEKDMNQIKDIFMTVNIFAFSSNNYHDFKKTIVGGQDYKGILDINNDIRACLQSSYSLGDTVIDVRFDTSQFDTIDTEKYPVRGMVMPVRILYRQINNV